ncbi:MAG: YqiA/YcfP family alpha/beta fold hydrolase [Parashewanella sp.]
MLLYIHGFNSSPLSDKGVQTAEYIQQYFPQLPFYQPQLPNCPKQAIELLSDIVNQAIARGETPRYLGSSLGGYFASYLSENYGGKAVLINPAVRPYELMAELIGEQYNPYTEQYFNVLPEHQDWLQQIDTSFIVHPDRFFVLLQTKDEVLNYRQAVAKYHCCKLLIESGGDHSFIGYSKHLANVCCFLELTND